MPHTSRNLIKKNDLRMRRLLEIREFSWLNLTPDSVMFPDNPRRNILLQEAHPREEWTEKIREAPQFSKSLGPARKVLTPVDLSEDFRTSQEEIMIRRKKRSMDEEELVSFELAELRKTERHEVPTWGKPSSAPEHAPAQEPAGPKAQQEPPREEARAEPAQEAVDFHPAPEEPQGPQPLHGALDAASEAHVPDLLAQEEAERAREAARKEGYALGLAQGKDEGLAQAKEDFATVSSEFFSRFTKVLEEVVELRTASLAAGQELFLELTKICAEKVLRVQLGASDESLRQVFRSCLELAGVNQSELEVEASPEDAARLRGIWATLDTGTGKALQMKITERPGIEAGDMRVLSSGEVVRIDLRKAVGEVVDGMKDALFPPAPLREAS